MKSLTKLNHSLPFYIHFFPVLWEVYMRVRTSWTAECKITGGHWEKPSSNVPPTCAFHHLEMMEHVDYPHQRLILCLNKRSQMCEITEKGTNLGDIQLHVVCHVLHCLVKLMHREFTRQSDCMEDLQQAECGTRLGLVNCHREPFTLE